MDDDFSRVFNVAIPVLIVKSPGPGDSHEQRQHTCTSAALPIEVRGVSRDI